MIVYRNQIYCIHFPLNVYYLKTSITLFLYKSHNFLGSCDDLAITTSIINIIRNISINTHLTHEIVNAFTFVLQVGFSQPRLCLSHCKNLISINQSAQRQASHKLLNTGIILLRSYKHIYSIKLVK